MTDTLWAARYWSDQLQKTSKNTEDILTKILLDCHSTKNLTVQEQYALAQSLMEFRSFSKLLAEDLTKPKHEPKPPLWKKLFRK